MNRLENWVCVFCKRASHYKGLGDLFGPYYIDPVNFKKSTDISGYGRNGESANKGQEIWFHEECIVWSNGVYLVGNKIRNMDEVVADCSQTVCCNCKLLGASLGCIYKGCQPRYHYQCAKERGCDMNEENFSIRCSKHSQKKKSSISTQHRQPQSTN